MHPEILSLLRDALAVAPTTVLTNGTLIDDTTADALACIAAAAPYSLEVRVSLDAPTAEENDALRGRGSFAKALAAVRRLAARDVLCFTHTGPKWHRALPSGRHALNVGALGRPENDGTPRVWYTLLTAERDPAVEFVPVHYDHDTLALEMAREGLAPEFIETIRTGWWTCCLESMPVKERARGRY